MELGDLVAELGRRGVDAILHGDPETQVGRVRHDSRLVEARELFACIPGARSDGHDFAPAAVAAGAAALLAERVLDLGVPVVEVASVRRALGPTAAILAGDPSRLLHVVGITGTNGKTTVSYLIESILVEAGRSPTVIGTLTGARTTPEAPELQDAFAAARASGSDSVVMEVSSHALDQHRVDGTRFACAAFTNLSADHLDHHGDMESYFAAKSHLFTPGFTSRAVVNVDDAHGARLAEAAAVPVVACSMADASDLVLAPDHTTFTWRGRPVRLHLTGSFNVANALVAATVAAELGVDEPVIASGLSRPVSVPGRMERVEGDWPFTVLVDFAHTPDGLRAVLEAAREVADPGAAITVVFGCGGDRDPSKRPLMGAVAAALADRTIVTSDNSRSEPTSAIIDAVLEGHAGRSPEQAAEVEEDRRRAIAAALSGAGPGDVVVIAGKGHETTQTIGATTVDLDDREVAREQMAALGFNPDAGGERP